MESKKKCRRRKMFIQQIKQEWAKTKRRISCVEVSAKNQFKEIFFKRIFTKKSKVATMGILYWFSWLKSRSPLGWGYMIHRLKHCRGIRPPTNECPGYDCIWLWDSILGDEWNAEYP